MQEKNLAGRFSPKNTMSETDGQTDTETEREGETGGRGRVTEREARQEQKADPRAGVGAMVQWGQIRGTVREGGWPPWERACGGVGGVPAQIHLGWSLALRLTRLHHAVAFLTLGSHLGEDLLWAWGRGRERRR